MNFDRDMRVLCLRADAGACAFYRITEPARVARDLLGINVDVSDSLPVVAYANHDGTIEIEEITAKVDVIVFQRPLLRAFTDVIEFAQLRGIACVVELDDDLASVHRENTAWHHLQPENVKHSNYMWARTAADMADWVIASTPRIAQKYAKHGRYSIIRNMLPESVFKVKKEIEDPPRLGWTGSVGTHPSDLDVAGSHIGTVLRRNDAGLSIVGDGEGVREKLYVRDTTPVRITGWLPLADYLPALAENVDVGFVPLELSEFNHAKSYLKGLEMAGLGIPFVASPTEEYLYFAEHFGCEIAHKPIHWQKRLNTYLANPGLVLEEGARLRGAVRGQTYEAHADQWVLAWQHALDHRRKMRV